MELQKELHSSKHTYESQECSTTVRFDWSCQSINWYLESEKHTMYHSRIIEELNPFIVDSRTILDIGSGIGSFAAEFSKRGYDVTAIDKSFLAVETLINKAKNMKLTNIKSINISYEDFIFGNSYDIIFISYMMGLVNKENIIKILENVNKHLILIMPYNRFKNDFSIDELYTELGINIKFLEQLNYIDIINILREENIKYILKKVKSEFGQPFNTFDETVKFIYHYFNLPQKKSNQIENWVRKKLTDLNGKFYLPNIRESVIIII